MAQGNYTFSKGSGACNIATLVSSELHERVKTLCNVLEMPKASLIRFLVNRGVDDLEKKLVQRIEKIESGEIHVP